MHEPTAITIGNFDGVHRGHCALVEKARDLVGDAGRVVAMMFDPHPLVLLRPGSAPTPLTTFEQRRRSLESAGVDEVVRLEPEPDLLALSPEQFIERIVDRFSPKAIVEGPDFRFGNARSGTTQTLEALGTQFGFQAVVIDPVEVTLTDHSVIRASSTIVRWLLTRGRVRDAQQVLGREFAVESNVTRGHQRGREIGFPTANLRPNGCLLPADGVYSGWAQLPDAAIVPAAISIGTNPTFNDGVRSCEAHLVDWTGPLDEYGWRMELRFDSWIRDQIAYQDVDRLIQQLHRDVVRCRQLTSVPHS